MDQQNIAIANHADVGADLLYIASMTDHPYSCTYDPQPGVARTNTANASHRVALHDARPIAGDPSLDREGFQRVEHRGAVHRRCDEELRPILFHAA
jgi:hypothetical protein